MIQDQLIYSDRIERLHPYFPQAFQWLKSFDPNTPDGKYEIVGQDCVAGVQRYQTKPTAEKKWEAHQVFGDIQVIFAGEEYCGHHDVALLQTLESYSVEKDVVKFIAPSQPSSLLHLYPSQFTIFYPSDAHQPGVQISKSCEVLKVVIKFKLKV
jgi:YhcH/YjgK/YiaL family protein